MSIFSNKLKEFIRARKISIYTVAKYCGMDRSNMYKIVQGTRHPASLKIVENIAKSLTLTPFERCELIEAWRISEVGEHIYFERKLISNFIERLKSEKEQPIVYNNRKMCIEFLNLEKGDQIIYGKNNLNVCIKSLIEKEIMQVSPEIYMMIQPEYDFLFKLLIMYGREQSRLKINHIICLESMIQKQENRYNLNCLNILAPMLMSPCNYEVYYYYDNIQSHFYNMNFFPYIILTSEFLLIITSDFEYGILSDDKEKSDLFKSLFKQYLERTNKLFEINANLQDVSKAFTNRDAYTLTGIITPGPIPGTLPITIAKKYFHGTETEKKQIENILDKAENYKEKIWSKTGYTAFFTEQGIRDFMDTGHIIDVTSENYDVMHKEDRIIVMESMLRAMQQQKIKGYLIKPGQLNMQRNFYMSSYGDEHSDIAFKNDFNCWRIVSIHEKSMGASINNFIHYLSESSMVYSLDESKEFVKNIIIEYKN